MALSAGCQIEIRNGGSDTVCSGAFDPTQTAGMYTDGAATSANTSAPVFSSASYNFVAGDVDAYLFIGAGTNWTKGWYKIASVASNQATLTATALGYQPYSDGVNTSDGCASVASPTGATWSIDYSQQAAAEITYTDLSAAGAGSTFTSAGFPFTSAVVGNAIRVTGGTNCTTGHHVITSVAAGVATFNNAVTTGATSDGAGRLGGALASPGYAGAVHIAGTTIWLRYHATVYSITVSTYNVAAGRFQGATGSATAPVSLYGYESVRGDKTANRPTYRVGVNNGNNWILLLGAHTNVDGIILDGNRANFTGGAGLLCNGTRSRVSRVKVMGMVFAPLNSDTECHFTDCEVTDCTVTCTAANSSVHEYCHWHDNTGTALTASSGSLGFTLRYCVFDTNGANALVVSATNSPNIFGCVFYGTTGAGILVSAAVTNMTVGNCIFEGNSTYGISCTTGSSPYRKLHQINNAFYNNTSGKYQTTYVVHPNIVGEIIPTVSPFVDAAGGDFRLNMKTGGGALLRGAGYPQTLPGTSYAHRRDIGAHQHSGPKRGING